MTPEEQTSIEPKRRGRPRTRTGPAKRPTFADTGVKLGGDRKRWLKAKYGNYQRGICVLIDAAMSAMAAEDSDDDLICESDEELAELEHRINYGYGAR